MKIIITDDCKISRDGISVECLKKGDTPDLTDDLALIVIEQMKKGEFIEEEKEEDKSMELPLENKSMGLAPENKDIIPEKPKEKINIPTIIKGMRVSEFSHKYRFTTQKVITAASNLKISATHHNSALTADEANKILKYLTCQ